MRPGAIVIVDWRNALAGSGEPNKLRPGVVIGSSTIAGDRLAFEIVVPLAGTRALAIEGASIAVDPTVANGCRARCYALAWNVQLVPHARLRETPSVVDDVVLEAIRSTVRGLIGGSAARA